MLHKNNSHTYQGLGEIVIYAFFFMSRNEHSAILHISFQVLSSYRPAGRKRWQCYRQARQVPNFRGFCLRPTVASKVSSGNLLAVVQEAIGFQYALQCNPKYGYALVNPLNSIDLEVFNSANNCTVNFFRSPYGMPYGVNHVCPNVIMKFTVYFFYTT